MSDNPEDRIAEMEEFIGHRVCVQLMVIGAQRADFDENEWDKRIAKTVRDAYHEFSRRDKTQRRG